MALRAIAWSPGGGNSQILFGSSGNNVINSGAGNDLVYAGAGNDTITQAGSTGGRDFVDGEGGVDSYQLNGSAVPETFTVYSRDAALANLAGLALNTNTEIVIARNGVVIAELDNIEEINVNSLQVSSPGGSDGGVSAGDTINVVGDFLGTSLNFNTITIEGSQGDDVVDISALQSAHRIVFRSNGGTDMLVGSLRPQDVIQLPDGATQQDYTSTVTDGLVTISSANHTISFAGETMPEIQFADGGAYIVDHDHDDDQDDDHDDDDDYGDHDDSSSHHGRDDDHDHDHGHGHGHGRHDDDHGGHVRHKLNGGSRDDTLTGTSRDDNMKGGSGDEVMKGGSGDDSLRGGSGDDSLDGGSGDDRLDGGSGDDVLTGGSGDDVLAGGSGDDVLSGGSGDDVLNGGSGDDVLTGGSGDDLFVFGANDRITDFSVGNDKIDLRDLGITSGTFASLVVLSASGQDTLLTINGSRMRIDDVEPDLIDMGDFVLEDAAAIAVTNAGSTCMDEGLLI